jgi:hypothetical protein
VAALAVAAVAAVATSPAPPAQAQSGYRVCGVYNSSTSAFVDHGTTYLVPHGQQTVGTGLVVKVAKGGGRTCDSKLGFMRTFYGLAYPGSSAQFSYRMVTCEAFGSSISGTSWDPCAGLETNKIYYSSSKYDALHPVQYPAFRWWHD